ncbi:MAG TPA: hypothetical protein VGB17_09630 [Pyrinomonadaceae bacterium]|jgi:hypothetical protein
MKRILRKAILTLVALTMLGSMALAKTKTKEITFERNVMVGSTLVKPGTYKAAFDEETGELTLSKNKKVVAKTTAKLEKSSERLTSAFATRKEGDDLLLTRITMDGGFYAIIGTKSEPVMANQ